MKGTWIIPISCTKISLWRSRHSASCNDDTEKDEADDCYDFDDREDKLGFSISADAKEIYEDDHEPEDYDEGGWRDVFCAGPVGDGN